jgi:branched-chain amino acid transport system substrate-binding protein
MKRLIVSAMCIIIGVLAIACSWSQAQTEAKSPEAPAKAEPIKIGAIFSITGPASNLGAPESKTVAMLVEKINAAGGVLGRPIQLIVKDSEGSPEKAVSFAKQLIEEQKVLAILGPSTSGETMQIKNLCEEAKVILMSCAAAEVIVNPVAKYVFKTPQKDSQAVTWIANTMKAMGITKVGVISDNTGFGNAGKQQVLDLLPKMGLEILISETYDKAATDLTDILTKLKGKGVQAVINWSIVPAQAIVAKNMKQISLNVSLFQSHGYGNIKYVQQGGQAAEGTIFPAGRLLVVDKLPDGHPQKTLLDAYKKNYEAAYKEDVSTFGGHAYDALMIVVKAIETAGSTDRAKVRDAIENLKGFVGTAGTFNFSPQDHNGLGLDAFEMLTVRDGKFDLYKK